MSDSGTEKLLGKLVLDYSQVSKAVEETNKLLSSLGKDANMDLTSLFDKKFGDLYKNLSDQIKNLGSSTGASSGKIRQLKTELEQTSSAAQTLLKTVTTSYANGNNTQTLTFLDQQNNIIKETIRNGKVLSQQTTVNTDNVKAAKTLSELSREQIRNYQTLASLEKALSDTRDDSQKEQLQAGVNAIRQQIQATDELLQKKKQAANYETEMAKVVAARSKYESKGSSYSEEERILSLLKERAKIEDEIYKIETVSSAADDKEKGKLEARLALQKQQQTAIDANVQQTQDQNAALSANPEIQQRINSNLEREIAHRQAIDKKTKEMADAEKRRSEILNSITKAFVSLLTVYATNAIKEFWSDSLKYVQQYYDQLNEIRIVTGMSAKDADALGKSYRTMAKEMSVSSTEIASAASEFWRQGLDESEVNARLIATTQYAKISGLAFEEAAKLVTAATNSMEQDASRVVDVFSYLGDASAAGADEIGIAMQKASASAQEAGVSFEWLGSYIATVSEKTRQAPEAIGTAFNSIMSRLQNLKTRGYNEEDETRINDVAKALGTIDIAIMDQSNNWRDMSDVFLDVAAKWGDLDDKQRAYIATAMAGTKQKNVFLTLMEDMSKAYSMTGEASRALELYEGAMNSVGTAAEKYSVWQESITAAQGRMKAAFEELYSLLDAEWMKGFYDGIAGLVSGFASVTDAMNGMNIVIPVILTGLGTVLKVISSFGGILPAISAIVTGVMSNWMIAIPAAIALGIGAMTALGGMVDTTEIDINQSLQSVQASLDNIKTSGDKLDSTAQKIDTLRTKYIMLSTDTSLTAQEQQELDGILGEIAALSPTLAGLIDGLTNKYAYQADVVAGLNAELRNRGELLAAQSRTDARETFDDLAGIRDQINKENEALQDRKSIIDEYILSLGNLETEEERNAAKRDFATKWIEQFSRENGLGKKAGLGVALENMFGINSRVPFGTKYMDHYVSEFVGWLDANFYAVQDSEKNLLAQEAQWKQQVYDIVSLWGQLDKFQTEPYRQLGKQIVDEVYAGINFEAADFEGELVSATNKIMDETNKLLEDEGKTMSESASRASLSALTSAYSKAMEDRTEESINAYNELVAQWNALGGVQFQPLDGSLAKSLEEVGNAAEGATGNLEETTTAAERYAETVQKRGQVKEARLSGYDAQFAELSAALGPEGTDLTSFNEKMNAFAQENFELYQDMLDHHEGLAQIMAGADGYTGQDALTAIDAMRLNALKEVEAWRQYYEGVGEMTASIPDPSSTPTADDILGQIQTLLLSNGETPDMGVSAVLDYLGTLSEESLALVSELIPGVETLTESTAVYSELLNSVNEQLVGTKENAAAFVESLSGIDEMSDESKLEYLDQFQEILSSEDGLENFRDLWGEMGDEQKDAVRDLVDENKELFEIIEDGSKDSKKAVRDLNKEFNKIKTKKLEELGEVWEGTTEAIEDMEDGGQKFGKSMKKLNGQLADLTEAQEAYNYITSDGEKDAEQTAEAYETLANFSGASADSLMNNLNPALYAIQNSQMGCANTAAALANMLFAAAGVQFNAATWQQQLAALGASADVTKAQVAALIQEMLTAAGATLYLDGNTIKVKWGNGVTGSNTPGRTAGGGGGGGGGGGSSPKSKSSSNEQTEIEKMVDAMERLHDLFEAKQNLFQEAQSYFEETGELQGLIKYYEKEKAAIEADNVTLEKHIEELEKEMKAQEKKVASMSRSSDKYQQEADDLKLLQETHQDYTQQLIENKTAIVELGNSIEDVYKDIREMEIELRDLIHEAIEDREDLAESMLEAEAEMQEEILDILSERYETEYDLAIEAAEAKQEALEREIDLLDEQLKKRKELNEEENKAAELAKLEAELQRISMDPTRQKEALELQKEIAELRDEIAWDLAEKEVEEQKKNLEDQIDNLDKYIDYMDKYYENIEDDPQALIGQVHELMGLSDAELIEWMKANSKDYAESPDAVQKEMVKDWEDTLREMHGETETYWDEVESIIAQGDDAIIEFLKANSEDYREAGKLQAEAYVDEWKEQLELLKLAYKDVVGFEDLEYDYAEILPYVEKKGSGSGGGGGGGGSGGGSGNGKYYSTSKNGNYYVAKDGVIVSDALAGASEAARAAYLQNKYENYTPYSSSSGLSNTAKKVATGNSSLTAYASGGVADYTGLAWLDGSPSSPERVLSPQQTALFESLIESLQSIKVTMPRLYQPSADMATGGQALTFGDINISVDSLQDDADFEEQAEKLMAYIAEEISENAAIGGIRFMR